jgi:ABC-type nitrate/sulfonate/bicarbonate transport system permease component
MDISGMFAVLLLLAGLGVGASKLLQIVRRRVLYWAASEHVG